MRNLQDRVRNIDNIETAALLSSASQPRSKSPSANPTRRRSVLPVRAIALQLDDLAAAREDALQNRPATAIALGRTFRQALHSERLAVLPGELYNLHHCQLRGASHDDLLPAKWGG